MSSNSITPFNPYAPQGSSAAGQGSQTSTQFQQNLEQLEQDATSDPNAAAQLLQSLPPGERHALMKALKTQDPQAAQSLHSAWEQQQAQNAEQQGQTSSQATSQAGLMSMVQLAQNISAALSQHNQNGGGGQQQGLGSSGGQSSFASMTA